MTSFHQCGGNVGDTCDIPLPAFVTSQGDIWYKDSKMPLLSVLHLPPGWQDQHGHEDKEYISLFADNVTIEGRSFSNRFGFVDLLQQVAPPCKCTVIGSTRFRRALRQI